jgi:hypothetical protein
MPLPPCIRSYSIDDSKRSPTYPIQYNINVAPCINHRRFSAQLDDLAEHTNKLVLEGLEVGREDARGLRVVHRDALGVVRGFNLRDGDVGGLLYVGGTQVEW